MKLILREYLASLRERGELDAVIPSLLSQMGLIVFSRPETGTRQFGVDVGAVGSVDGSPESVYLLSLKPGDLTRSAWDGESLQSLRPSLNEIIDVYVPTRLPSEHQGKPVVICICLGGEVKEAVRSSLSGFEAQSSTDRISFAEWNGDFLASKIEATFLREELLPKDARPALRKALALLDEPESAFKHFARLVRSISAAGRARDSARLTSLRQLSLCLWILFAWCREAGNLEAAYRAAEVTLLHAWDLVRSSAGTGGKIPAEVASIFFSIFEAYDRSTTQFLEEYVLPHTGKRHALSSAIGGRCWVDVNLKMFDLLGRLGVAGLWRHWAAARVDTASPEVSNEIHEQLRRYTEAIPQMISNNPALLTPARDDQAIDIAMAATLLALDGGGRRFVVGWMREVLGRSLFAMKTNGHYPCTVTNYSELLSHPSPGDEYRKAVTAGSVLYPLIALWAALLEDSETVAKVGEAKREVLAHCNLQFWYPDETSEDAYYTNADSHGGVLSNVPVDRSPDDLVSQVFAECDASDYFERLSAVRTGWWPLLLVASRHYRRPPPLHFLRGLRRNEGAAAQADSSCEPAKSDHSGE